MATFTHTTPERCAQLGRALTAADLDWSDNAHHDDLKYLAYSVTDPHGRTWRITPATDVKVSASHPAQIWQAICDELAPGVTTTPVMSAHRLAAHIKDCPKICTSSSAGTLTDLVDAKIPKVPHF
ncbi:hypothetical protein [Streptomyces mirabilis]|uniref:hypothetical protein n=1 Tax=Streptomyces mirabilis TaxID=68239 RepID=UPI0021C250C4|nr:hypothetical protein [Streptomyces mirabilis]MCT9105363.1 hypothetical protein [Streptomyces mirabilis]